MGRAAAGVCVAFALLLSGCGGPGAQLTPAVSPAVQPALGTDSAAPAIAFDSARVHISELSVPPVAGFISWPNTIDVAGDGAVYFGRGVGCCFGAGATPGLFRYLQGRFTPTRGYSAGASWDGGGLVDDVYAHDGAIIWSSPYSPEASPLSRDFIECGANGSVARECRGLSGPIGAAVYSILVDSRGMIWIAGESCCGGILGGGFGYPARLPFNTNTFTAFSLTLTRGPNGNVWGALTGQAGPVYEFAPTGAVLHTYTLPLGTVLPSTPGNDVIVEGRDGALWFVDDGHNAIGRLSVTGQVNEYPVPSRSSGLAGIARGRDGGLWFTESNANKIGRIDMSGAIREFTVPSPNAGLGAIASPPQNASCNPAQIWFTEANVQKIATLQF